MKRIGKDENQDEAGQPEDQCHGDLRESPDTEQEFRSRSVADREHEQAERYRLEEAGS